MANPNPNYNPNRTPKQDWREKGWQSIEGGQGAGPRVPNDIPTDREVEPGREWETSGNAGIKLRKADHPILGDDYRDAVRRDVDPAAGYPPGYENPVEPRPEKNYPNTSLRGGALRDDLINTDLNPMMEVPRKPGATLRILGIVLALAVAAFVIWLMFYHETTETPAPRKPGAQSMVRPQQNDAVVQFAAMVHRAQFRQRQ